MLQNKDNKIVCIASMSKSDVFLKINMNFVHKSISAFKRIHKKTWLLNIYYCNCLSI